MVNHEKLLDTLQRCSFLLSGKIGKTIDENIDYIDGNFSRGDDVPIDTEIDDSLLEPELHNLQCDVCHGFYHEESIYHFSGFLDHDFKKHWHVCPKCLNKLNLKYNLIDVTTGAK